MTSRAHALLASLAVAAGCVPRADPRLVSQPIASSRQWVSTLYKDHPLVGRIWEPRADRFADEAAVVAALVGADTVLLGEMHDNVDHHLLQARLVRAVLAAGRRPALAFEMLSVDQQETVDAALARSPRDPDALAKAVAWNKSGWPEFDLYRPIFQAGLDAGVPVVAANLPRKVVREVVSKGTAALDAPLRERIEKAPPLTGPAAESLRAEMRESHCGELPESLLDPLVLAQRARDAEMAVRMEGAGARGAILIAGRGHVRTDRGVPSYLRRDEAGRRTVSVAFFEVDPDQEEPQGYLEPGESGPLPFDFAVFTPGQEREDPCEGLRHTAKERAAAHEREAKDAAKQAGQDGASGAGGAKTDGAANPSAPEPPAPPGPAAPRP